MDDTTCCEESDPIGTIEEKSNMENAIVDESSDSDASSGDHSIVYQSRNVGFGLNQYKVDGLSDVEDTPRNSADESEVAPQLHKKRKMIRKPIAKRKSPAKRAPRGKRLKRSSETTEKRLLDWINLYSNTNYGIWIQCNKCNKWRWVKDYEEQSQVPFVWDCSMNSDESRNSCSLPEDESHSEERTDFEFAPGSIVWAKVPTYPWWPAMVEDDPDFEEYYCQDETGKVIEYHVTFLDDKVTRAWVPMDKIRSFRRKEALPKMAGKNRSLLPLLEEAQQKAFCALCFTLGERLKKYSFAYRFGGRWPKAIEDSDDEDLKERLTQAKILAEEVEKLDPDKLLNPDDTEEVCAEPEEENELELPSTSSAGTSYPRENSPETEIHQRNTRPRRASASPQKKSLPKAAGKNQKRGRKRNNPSSDDGDDDQNENQSEMEETSELVIPEGYQIEDNDDAEGSMSVNDTEVFEESSDITVSMQMDEERENDMQQEKPEDEFEGNSQLPASSSKKKKSRSSPRKRKSNRSGKSNLHNGNNDTNFKDGRDVDSDSDDIIENSQKGSSQYIRGAPLIVHHMQFDMENPELAMPESHSKKQNCKMGATYNMPKKPSFAPVFREPRKISANEAQACRVEAEEEQINDNRPNGVEVQDNLFEHFMDNNLSLSSSDMSLENIIAANANFPAVLLSKIKDREQAESSGETRPMKENGDIVNGGTAESSSNKNSVAGHHSMVENDISDEDSTPFDND